MAGVTMRKLMKTYGRTRVIHDIDACIEDGEFVVIVGPSGCGKSTILRMIAGLEKVTGGDILIDDRPVNKVEPKDRDIAMVFQNYALYPHMTVFNNMAYGLKLRRFDKKEIAARVKEVAALLQIEDLLNRKPGQLSGGQRQRVAMGRAIVRQPSVFLFDEPLSNLDAKLRQNMRIELKKLHTTIGATMIYVTHDQVEAMTLADRIMVLRDGRIEQIGTPRQVYNNPETLFCARFIGSPEINVIVCGAPGGCKLAEPDHALVLDTDLFPDKAAGNYAVGLRPEHVRLNCNPEENDLVLPAGIELVERLGADTVYYLTCKTAAGRLVARTAKELGLSAGDAASVGFRWKACHFFDTATGKRRPRPEWAG